MQLHTAWSEVVAKVLSLQGCDVKDPHARMGIVRTSSLYLLWCKSNSSCDMKDPLAYKSISGHLDVYKSIIFKPYSDMMRKISHFPCSTCLLDWLSNEMTYYSSRQMADYRQAQFLSDKWHIAGSPQTNGWCQNTLEEWKQNKPKNKKYLKIGYFSSQNKLAKLRIHASRADLWTDW